MLGRHNSITTNEIIDNNVLSAMLALIGSVKHKNQLAGLAVISGLAMSSEAAAKKLLTSDALHCLKVCSDPDCYQLSLWSQPNLLALRLERNYWCRHQSQTQHAWPSTLLNARRDMLFTSFKFVVAVGHPINRVAH